MIFTQYYSDFYDFYDEKKKKLMTEGLNLCPPSPNIEFCLYTHNWKYIKTLVKKHKDIDQNTIFSHEVLISNVNWPDTFHFCPGDLNACVLTL